MVRISSRPYRMTSRWPNDFMPSLTSTTKNTPTSVRQVPVKPLRATISSSLIDSATLNGSGLM
ncbi:Uncharacterised protein [Bordetella pertussis]|nr:Uncharacterised protein [Bordetella pertussis]